MSKPTYDELKKRIKELEKTKERTKELTATAAVLNDMLRGEVDDAETEKRILETCLAATDSIYGMIGVINEHGKYDTTTYSSQTLQDCAFPEALAWEISTGMTIRGVWGWAMLQGKPLLCNDLQAHPDRVSLPKGHVPLHCFLGVPLKRNEKVVGMVAVANKPGGYTQEDRDTLVRLASVISVSRQHQLALIASKRTSIILEQLVTERTKQLSESEVRFRTLMEQSPISIQIMSTDGRITQVNDAYVKLWGVALKDLSEYNILKDEQAKSLGLMPYIERAFAGESLSLPPFEYVPWKTMKKGKIRWIQSCIYPVKDKNGKILNVIMMHEDITERKQVEELLKKSEKEFRNIIENLPMGIHIYQLQTDGQLRFTGANPAADKILGVDNTQYIGKTIYEAFPKISETDIPERFRTIAEKGGVWKKQDIVYKDATIEGVFENYNFQASPGKMVSLFLDITKRKKAEEELRKHREHLEKLVEERTAEIKMINEQLKKGITERKKTEEVLRDKLEFEEKIINGSPIGISIYDASGQCIAANESIGELIGATRKQILEQNYNRIGSWKKSGLSDKVKKAVNEKSKQRHEFNVKSTFGKNVSLDCYLVPFSSEGQQHLLLMTNDISERMRAEEALKKSEERYSLAQKVANIGSWDWNIKTGELTWSDTIEPMFGFGQGEFGATYKAFLECVHSEDRQFVIDSVNNCIEKGEDYNIEHRIVWSNGTIRWMSETGNVIRNEKGRAIRMLGIVHDITKRKRAEDALKERVKELNGLYGLGKLADVGNLEELFNRFLKNIVPESMKFPDKVCAKIELDKEEYRYTNYKCVNCLFAPIIVKGERRGKLTIGYVEEIPFFKEFEQEFEQELVSGYAERLGKIIERIEAKDELQKAYYELEKRVIERTIELTKLNKGLKQEIIERKKAEEELKSSRKQCRDLSLYLQDIREEERTRIAREIHDDLGQALTALKMDLSWLENRLPENQKLLFDKTASMSRLIDSTIRSVQRISAELRPGLLDDLGLADTIEWQAEEFQKRSDISCKVKLSFDNDTLDSVLSTAIFRIFQETLTNIVRHSNATKASVSVIDQSGKLTIEVKDNGKGITKEQISDAKSLGIIGMRERVRPWGGEVNIKGKKGKGTTVTVIIPMAKPSLRD